MASRSEIAQELYDKGRFQHAVRVCRLGLLETPADLELRYILGAALLRLGDPEGERWLEPLAAQMPKAKAALDTLREPAWDDAGDTVVNAAPADYFDDATVVDPRTLDDAQTLAPIHRWPRQVAPDSDATLVPGVEVEPRIRELTELFGVEGTRAIAGRFREVSLQAGEFLSRADDQDDSIFVITDGHLARVDHSGQVCDVLRRGDVLVPANEPSSSHERLDVRAESAALAVAIPMATVKALLAAGISEYFSRLLDSPVLRQWRRRLLHVGFREAEIRDFLLSLQHRLVPEGTLLQRAGEPVDAVRWIETGRARETMVVPGGQETAARDIGRGEVIGLLELMQAIPSVADRVALTPLSIFELDARRFARLAPPHSRLHDFFIAHLQEMVAALTAQADDEPDDDDEDMPDIELFLKEHGVVKPKKRAFIRQHDTMDCAAACMAMVAHSHGRKIDVATYRRLIHVTREGASMWSMLRAARTTGFEALGVMGSYDALADVNLPCVLNTRYHFVVLHSITPTHAVIGDPGIGMRRLTKEQLCEEWSGACLFLRPTPRLYEYPESRSSYAKYLRLLRGSRGSLVLVLIASLLLFLFQLASPLFTQVLFDRVLMRGEQDMLTILLLGMAVAAGFEIATSTSRQYLLGFAGLQIDARFASVFYQHMVRLPLGFFMVRRVGDLLLRFGEMRKIREFITGDTIALLVQALSIFIYLAALFLYSIELGILACVAVPVVFALSTFFGRRLRRLHEALFHISAKGQSLLVEHFRSLESIKSIGAEVAARWRWDAARRAAVNQQFRVELAGLAYSVLNQLVEKGILLAVLYLGATLALEGELTIGQVLATGMFASSVLGPIKSLGNQWAVVQETAVALARVDDIMTVAAEREDDISPAPADDAPRFEGNIAFENVWFQYGSDASPWAVKGLNFSIRAGETVAIVGRSGSGKSTLVQMLSHLYVPTKGTIRVDGMDAGELHLSRLRRSVGLVMQKSQLFSGSVLKNIAFGAEEPSVHRAVEVARLANAHDFISKLEQGYHTELDEGGVGLSGGQKQRISIARALYHRPTVLILDEATNNLDPETEEAVVRALRDQTEKRTTIIIAHRLSTVAHADRVLVMKDGRIVESGTHDELMRAGGEYAELFAPQLAI